MKLISLTQGKFAKVDDEDFEWLSQYRWRYKLGYAVRNEGKWPNQKTIFMHREIMKTPNRMETDHINMDGIDNRKKNLRICIHFQNRANTKPYSNNKSGYKGVSWSKRRHKWHVQIQKNGKKTHKFFDNIDDAAREYDKLAKELFGDFSRSNF